MICKSLRNVPEAKFNLMISELNDPNENKNIVFRKAYNKYYESNIPIIYWNLHMSKFNGDISLSEAYNSLTVDIKETYRQGKAYCFAGSFGRGKSMTVTNILKRASEKGYSALYVTLNDIISAVFSDEAYAARKELLTVDFLVIDEFDSRHIPNSNTSIDFFARTIEDVFRTRLQNAMPLYLCTNSPNPLEAFKGSLKESITSLWHHVEMVPVIGKDFRIDGIK